MKGSQFPAVCALKALGMRERVPAFVRGKGATARVSLVLLVLGSGLLGCSGDERARDGRVDADLLARWLPEVRESRRRECYQGFLRLGLGTYDRYQRHGSSPDMVANALAARQMLQGTSRNVWCRRPLVVYSSVIPWPSGQVLVVDYCDLTRDVRRVTIDVGEPVQGLRCFRIVVDVGDGLPLPGFANAKSYPVKIVPVEELLQKGKKTDDSGVVVWELGASEKAELAIPDPQRAPVFVHVTNRLGWQSNSVRVGWGLPLYIPSRQGGPATREAP